MKLCYEKENIFFFKVFFLIKRERKFSVVLNLMFNLCNGIYFKCIEINFKYVKFV